MNLLNKLTLKNLKLNKKRTIMTIIGIMLSVALITAVTAMFFSAQSSVIKYETRQKGNYHYSFNDVPESEIKYFKENRNLEMIYLTQNIGYADLKESKNKNKPYAYIKAFDSLALKNLSVNLTSGRLPENENEILIPTHLKTNGRIEYKIGDTLTLEVGKRIDSVDKLELDQSNPYNGDKIKEEIVDTITKEYKIVGIIERLPYNLEGYSAPGYTFVSYLDTSNIKGKVSIYTRYTKDALKKDNVVTSEILEVDQELFTRLYYPEGFGLDISVEEIIKLYEELGDLKYDYDHNEYLIMLETGIFKESSMRALAIVALIVVVIIIFTSVFCIKNSFNISITEKIKQYGMLSSIGATSKQIKKNVYCEALMLGIVGIPLGIISGLLASYILIIISNYLIGESMGIKLIYSFSWLAIVFAILLGLITLYLSAWRSARIASKITPLTAIRNSEDIKIKGKKLKSPKYIKKIFGVGGDISYKNLKRNKKKYRATVVSIIVCSSVFIALSAFINIAFDYIKRDFESTDYNIVVSYRADEKNRLQDKAHEITKLDHVIDYSILVQSNLTLENNLVKFSDEYLKYYPHTIDTYTVEDEEGNVIEKMASTYLNVYKVGDHAYKKYLDELGLDYEKTKDKAILINKTKIMVPKEENSNDYVEKTVPYFNYKKGDILTWNLETGKLDENNEYINKEINLELAYIADKYPFGLKNLEYRNMLIISDEQFDKIFSEYLNEVHEEITIYSDNATKLQDEIEKILTDTDSYNLFNTEEQVRQMKSFYLLVAIFLYGFITVIALIGITNIFNTITTNMELRSREFATLKSIGMTSKEFNRMISLESFFYGTKSLIIGIPIGTIIAYIIHKILTQNDSTIAFKLPISAIIIATLAVFILITCIMKYSINKINKQNTIETIRNENI